MLNGKALRGEHRTGNGRSRDRRPPLPTAVNQDQEWATRPLPLTEASRAEAALAGWICAALLGIFGGLAVAKYAQAWARATLHPAAVLGGLLVLASTGLAYIACARYLDAAVRLPGARSWSRALVVLSLLLITGLAWSALSIIAFAGWAWPMPAR